LATRATGGYNVISPWKLAASSFLEHYWLFCFHFPLWLV